MAAISLDFLGVPGELYGTATCSCIWYCGLYGTADSLLRPSLGLTLPLAVLALLALRHLLLLHLTMQHLLRALCVLCWCAGADYGSCTAQLIAKHGFPKVGRGGSACGNLPACLPARPCLPACMHACKLPGGPCCLLGSVSCQATSFRRSNSTPFDPEP